MTNPVEELINYIQGRDEFHKDEIKNLNFLLSKVDPNNIPIEHKKEIRDVLDMMFLLNRVDPLCLEHINKINQKLSKQ